MDSVLYISYLADAGGHGWQPKPSDGNLMERTKSKQKQQAIGYYATRQEAMTALVQYDENPYDLNFNKTTFSEVYEKWSEEYFPTLSNASSIRTITAAYKYCTPLYDMRIKDIRVEHLEGTIHSANVGSSTKGRMKSLFNLMYKWAMKHELVDKNYAALCDGVKSVNAPMIVRIPFSEQEITALMEHPENTIRRIWLVRNLFRMASPGTGSSESCRCRSG